MLSEFGWTGPLNMEKMSKGVALWFKVYIRGFNWIPWLVWLCYGHWRVVRVPDFQFVTLTLTQHHRLDYSGFQSDLSMLFFIKSHISDPKASELNETGLRIHTHTHTHIYIYVFFFTVLCSLSVPVHRFHICNSPLTLSPFCLFFFNSSCAILD